MKKAGVPARILIARFIVQHEPTDFPRYKLVDAVRHVRKWFEDPTVPDDLRKDDVGLIEKLKDHLSRYPRPRMHIITREELDERTREIELEILASTPQ